jgi:LacI family transcriptional regulator
VSQKDGPRPTINNIARLAGVSRGTVDRAINNRPGVNEHVARRIRRIAQELGYAPNRAAKALRFNYEPKTIGVVLPTGSDEFFGDVVRGIRQAEQELNDMGVHAAISVIDESDDDRVSTILSRFAETGEAAGIIMTGPDTEHVRTAIDAVAEAGIPVVTINSDVPGSRRLCFVGQDLYKSGVLAAELMGKLTGDVGRVVAVTGNLQFQAHRDRIAGFKDGLNRWATHLDIEVREGQDTYEGTVSALESAYEGAKTVRTEIVGVYMATGIIDGCLDVLAKADGRVRPRLITNDVLPVTRKGLADGTIDFTIFQDPVYQGYMPMKVLYEYLLTKQLPDKAWFQSPIRIVGSTELDLP